MCTNGTVVKVTYSWLYSASGGSQPVGISSTTYIRR